jgi:hypothetical protein
VADEIQNIGTDGNTRQQITKNRTESDLLGERYGCYRREQI